MRVMSISRQKFLCGWAAKLEATGYDGSPLMVECERPDDGVWKITKLGDIHAPTNIHLCTIQPDTEAWEILERARLDAVYGAQHGVSERERRELIG